MTSTTHSSIRAVLALSLLLLVSSLRAQALSDHVISAGGHERSYSVHDFSAGGLTPVVILLHGGGGWGANMAEMSGFDAVAEREKLIAVYPDGSGRRQERLLTWNAGHCCAFAMEQQVDDVAFISRLIDVLIAEHRADPQRIYVTGLSNGAMMTHRLGRELSGKIAAIGTVVGAVFGDENASGPPVPALIINGTQDTLVPFAGGEIGAGRRSRRPLLQMMLGDSADRPAAPAVQQADYWSNRNQCRDSLVESTDKLEVTRHMDCNNGAEVVFVEIKDGGHAWPGGRKGSRAGDTPVTHYSANEELWRFFSRHAFADRGHTDQTVFKFVKP